MLAIFLSILFPGLGQFYYGKNIRGLLMFALALTPLYFGALIWSVYDVVKLNQKGLAPKFNRKEALWIVVLLLVIIPLSVGVMLFGVLKTLNWYSHNYGLAKSTRAEGAKIVRALESYRENEDHYPENLNKLLEGRPIRNGWLTDQWGMPYTYSVSEKGQSYILISKGKDQALSTEDDITLSP